MEEISTPNKELSNIEKPTSPQIKNSLLMIMSVVTILSVGIASFFAYQSQHLAKELSKYQVQTTPTSIPTPSPNVSPSSSPSVTQSGSPKACTQEAKLCPDGSYVGRTGLNCEFAPCPVPTY